MKTKNNLAAIHAAGYIGQGITVQDLQELSLNELNHFLYDEFMKQNSDETVVELDDLF